MNIDDMNQGKMIESMLPDVERSDTKSDLFAENQLSLVKKVRAIFQKEQDQIRHLFFRKTTA